MFVLNKKTGNVQECHNMDAIKSCRKDTETYSVAERQEELVAEGGQKSKKSTRKEKTDKSTAEEKRAVNEAAMVDGDGGEGQQVSDEEKPDSGTTGLDEERLAEMNLQALREKAKEMEIPGYTNMNKDTLIAMLLNH